VLEPFREYGRGPITMEQLGYRYGSPVRVWEEEGRPFAEYALPDGVLQFGLEQTKSGSSVHQEWKLRWRSASADFPFLFR
jgi:hypothetical protein